MCKKAAESMYVGSVLRGILDNLPTPKLLWDLLQWHFANWQNRQASTEALPIACIYVHLAQMLGIPVALTQEKQDTDAQSFMPVEDIYMLQDLVLQLSVDQFQKLFPKLSSFCASAHNFNPIILYFQCHIERTLLTVEAWDLFERYFYHNLAYMLAKLGYLLNKLFHFPLCLIIAETHCTTPSLQKSWSKVSI